MLETQHNSYGIFSWQKNFKYTHVLSYNDKIKHRIYSFVKLQSLPLDSYAPLLISSTAYYLHLLLSLSAHCLLSTFAPLTIFLWYRDDFHNKKKKIRNP
jgi:hypothetical protein